MNLQQKIDRKEYPFQSHYFELECGKMHYVDEGQGPLIIMIHGTPTWSFLYRHLIKALSKQNRVIALDNIGFGLSDNPQNWSYTPKDHSKNVAKFINDQGFTHFTLVVHDFGGPIGLSYALANPEKINNLILFNTWMWSLANQPSVVKASKFFGSFIGKVIYKYLNFSPKFLLKAMMGDKSKLTKAIHQHYLAPFSNAQERHSTWVFAKELIGSSDWFEELWSHREKIKEKPVLFLWGMKDPAFKPNDLEKWKSVFNQATVIEFPESGHFVQEEGGEKMLQAIHNFVNQQQPEKSRMPA